MSRFDLTLPDLYESNEWFLDLVAVLQFPVQILEQVMPVSFAQLDREQLFRALKNQSQCSSKLPRKCQHRYAFPACNPDLDALICTSIESMILYDCALHAPENKCGAVEVARSQQQAASAQQTRPARHPQQAPQLPPIQLPPWCL